MSSLVNALSGVTGVEIYVPRAIMCKLLMIAYGNELMNKLRMYPPAELIQQYAQKMGCYETTSGDFICTVAWRNSTGELILNFDVLEPLLFYLFVTFGYTLQHATELAKIYADEARKLYQAAFHLARGNINQAVQLYSNVNHEMINQLQQAVKEAVRGEANNEVTNMVTEIEELNKNGEIPNVEELPKKGTIGERLKNIGSRIVNFFRKAGNRLMTFFRRRASKKESS